MKKQINSSSFYINKLLVAWLLVMFTYTVTAQNTSYSANTIPISGTLNSGFGVSVLPSTTALSHDNVAAGNLSMFTNTNGNYNTAVGVKTLYFNLAGNANTAFGWSALYNNASAGGNTAIGNQALFTNTAGSNNTALGSYADVATNSLTNATALGYQASVTASNTIQLGNASVTQIFAGTGNTATVITGGLKVTGGTPGVGKILTSDAVGNATWQTYVAGDWNIFGNNFSGGAPHYVGTVNNEALNFLVNNTKAGTIDPTSQNEFYGQFIATGLTTGNHNVAMGYSAFNTNTSGSSCTGIGYAALKGNGTGSFNTALGQEADLNVGGLTHATAIGYGAKVLTNYEVVIGENTPGMIIGGYANWTNLSDGRFKENVKENVPGLAFINKLRPVTYTIDVKKLDEHTLQNSPDKDKVMSSKERLYAYAKAPTKIQTGFIAQEVEKTAEDLHYDFDGVNAPQNATDHYTLAYSQFVIPLVKSVQELSRQNEEMKKEIEELKALVKGKTEGSIKITEANDAQLFQNAPNPFNKSTVIKYAIPFTAKKAVLNITSISGTKIKEFDLSNKAQSVEISGGQLSAGTYIYSLYVDDVFIDSKQMILTK